MAYKRSRATFEADSQSPFVFYGTALPSLDDDVRDDGSYVPIWKQDATDEQGRKRFHGAFTGGFSAGFFNTVGSKEGWTPSTFVSSRSKRAKDGAKNVQQRPEDFMDDEDLDDAAESKHLQTAGSFSGLGSTHGDPIRRNALIDVMRPRGMTIGTKLLQRMGWREGQGVGPKVRRKARLEASENRADDGDDTHLFAPENTKMIGFVRKNDCKGLGYQGEARLGSSRTRNGETKRDEDDDDDDNDDEGDDNDSTLLARSKTKSSKDPKSRKQASFGVGVLNDTGSDEDDLYDIGPKITYNRTIAPVKKPKKPGGIKSSTSSNPLLNSKPVFLSKKKTHLGFRKCHDGRLPLEGFILSMKVLDLGSTNKHPPPKIPEGWKTTKSSTTSVDPQTQWQSTADAAKSSSLDPKTRASMLGEASLPGKSVFDYLSTAARDRLANASGRVNLPAALNEAPPEAYRKSDADKQKQLWNLVPALDKDVASAALARGSSGWMPYADDEVKRNRYRTFLELRANLRDTLPDRAKGATVDEWIKEMQEFAQAAMVFRPISGAMASRFTSSSRTFEGSTSKDQPDDQTSLLRKPASKPEDPAEAAAKIGMYGPMTRSARQFYPTRLVCKRFGVRPPDNVTVDPGDAMAGESATPSVPEVVSQTALDQMMRDAAIRKPAAQTGNSEDSVPLSEVRGKAVVDVEKNDALEAERPGDAVFKAIFGSDDDDSD